jgi:hypothetical protein
LALFWHCFGTVLAPFWHRFDVDNNHNLAPFLALVILNRQNQKM